MITIWFQLMALFLYFVKKTKETDMKLIVRLAIIVVVTLLVGVFDNTLAAVILMAVSLLLKKQIKSTIGIVVFGGTLFLPYLGIYLTSI